MIEKLSSFQITDYLSAFAALLGAFKLLDPNTQKSIMSWLSKTFTLKNVQYTVAINFFTVLVIGFMLQFVPYLISIACVAFLFTYRLIFGLSDVSGGSTILVYIILNIVLYLFWGLGSLLPDSAFNVFYPIEYVTGQVNTLFDVYPIFKAQILKTQFIENLSEPFGFFDVREFSTSSWKYINLFWLLYKASDFLSFLSMCISGFALLYGIYKFVTLILTMVFYPIFELVDWIIARQNLKENHIAVLVILLGLLGQLIKFFF